MGSEISSLKSSSASNFCVEPARSSIELSKIKFKGGFRYNETSQTYYREHDPAEPQYIGPPSPEIDQAWEELLGGMWNVA